MLSPKNVILGKNLQASWKRLEGLSNPISPKNIAIKVQNLYNILLHLKYMANEKSDLMIELWTNHNDVSTGRP